MIVSVTMLCIITLYQILSGRVSDIINHTLVIFKITTLLIISIIGIVKLGINHDHWNSIFDAPFDFGAYGSGLIKVLLTYEGWNNVNYLIEEFKPRSDNLEYPSVILKYSSLISVGITFLLCFFSNAAFITVVGYNVTDTPIPMRFGKELFGETGEILMSILVAISSFGCISALIFTYSRVIKYAAETGFMPRRISSWFTSYRKRSDTLCNQLSAQFFYCLILSFIFLIKTKYNISDNISDYFADASQYSAMIYHGASAYCLYILKKKLKNTNPRIFSIPIYMIIIYLIIIILIVFALFFPPGNGNLHYMIPYCISWTAGILGIIIWWIRDRKRSEVSNCEKNRTEESIGNKPSLRI
ncbi:amino acid/polyamine transporter I [Gigaspora rosea]|uniref:Amino acid/polyamine transporter I n=1 Tax=Gigaspora rosea TaxID=44941 RepID=A0A397W863_9GLOM|nr:amino acid/polyamine transporter I [Gigaspora rosea]